MRQSLIRREVTDEEFNQALANEDNKRLIKSVLRSYRRLIPEDDLECCGLDGLWRCLGYHREGMGNKLTTSLHKFVHWECRRKLKKIMREAEHRAINISAIETQDKFEIPEPTMSSDMVNMLECVSVLREPHRELIKEYYYDQRTMEEIGQRHGYSKEAARQKINRAVKELKKLCLHGV